MYPIHELAGIVAMANEYEQLSLTEDIRDHGQREPAVLWKGELVDGRCRQLACYTLGIPLQIRELGDELSIEQVTTIVKSLNTRRNLTDTQKAMSAYKAQEKDWVTNEELAKKWGIPLGTYKNARYVAMHRPELVEPLFNGKSVEVLDPDKGYVVTTNKINTLARIVKKMREKEVVSLDKSEEVSFAVDGRLKTEVAKDWYYSRMSSLGIPENAWQIRMDYVELANLKFKVIEDEGSCDVPS